MLQNTIKRHPRLGHDKKYWQKQSIYDHNETSQKAMARDSG